MGLTQTHPTRGIRLRSGIKAGFAFGFFLALLLFSQGLVAGQNVSLEIQGQCMGYNVTVKTQGLGEGCYDVKIDVTTPAGRVGEIFDPRQGWKSSFFFVNEGLCIGGQNTSTFQVRAGTTQDLNFAGSLRFGSKTWDTGFYEIKQNCPITAGQDYQAFWIAALLAILVLVAGITLYVKVLR